MTSELRADAIKTVDGTEIISYGAYANFGHYFSDDQSPQIATNATNTTFPIARVFNSLTKNITVDVSNNRWTHAQKGMYMCHIAYRQTSGGDIWTFYGVTKDGNTDCVGYTARMGSEDNHTESFHFLYQVDSTTSTYQIQTWANGNREAGYSGGNPHTTHGSPSWTGFFDGATQQGGKCIDIMVYRIGDLT